MFIPWYGFVIIAVAFLWALTRGADVDGQLRAQIDDLENRIEQLENAED